MVSKCRNGRNENREGENMFALIHEACGSLNNGIPVASKEKKYALSNY